MRFLCLTLIISWSLLASAQDDCETVRLDQDNGPMQDVPVVDQHNEGNCYIQTAALMMTGKLQQMSPQKPPFVVAPEKIWSLLLTLPKEEKDKILSATAGRTCEVFNLAKISRSCDRSKVLDLGQRFIGELKKGFWGSVFGPSAKDPEFALLRVKNHIENLAKSSRQLPRDRYCKAIEDGLLEVGMTKNEIGDILKVTEEASLEKPEMLFDLVLNRICQESNATRPPIAETRESPPMCQKFDFIPITGSNDQELHPPGEFKRHLHQLLDQPADQRLPIGIEYCSGILKKDSDSLIKDRRFPTNVDYLNTDKEASKNLLSSCGFHASVVIGKKRIAGKCHFLVQNSWGTSCNYTPDKDKCENGKIWVDEDKLSENLMRISHF